MNILNIKDLYYEADNTKILNGVSISINNGDCISIVGQSGSGKSTLMKLCADLIPITKGSVFFNNIDYKKYNPIELRRKISYCTQLPHLFGDTVRENLEFPFKIRKEKINLDKITYLLERFNLNSDYLDKDIKSLSGGEKQRISIIRNLIYTPDILLLDESTSALDKENSIKVQEYVKELNLNGTTVLWITHSMEQSTSIFNKRIFMSEGKIEKVEEIN
ncbi:ABC transporter ATP-binding protein [Clostridium sp.]|uniref:ABC transporter ATP-binding protein n=1 Tax=Clostridium sp. TaxID=1506 RepID=UPI003F3A9195